MPYQVNFGTAGADDSATTLEVSTKTATQTITAGGDNEAAGRATLRLSAVVVVGAVALLWLSAYGLK